MGNAAGKDGTIPQLPPVDDEKNPVTPPFLGGRKYPQMKEGRRSHIVDGDVDRLFEQVLDSMALKAEVREVMRGFPLEKKWMIIQQNRVTSRSQEDPKTTVESLINHTNDQQTYLQLRPVINASSKEWITSFVEAGGLKALLSAGKTLHFNFGDRGEIMVPCIMCLNAFMNNEVGILFVNDDQESVEDMALWFDSPNPVIKNMILKLLSVYVAYFGQPFDVLNAFKKYKEVVLYNEGRMHPVVNTLRKVEDVETRKTIMVFINTTINFIDHLEERVLVRQEYIDLGILDVIEDLRLWVCDSSGEEYRALVNQMDIFENFRVEDIRECNYRGVDLSDPDACYGFLREVASEDGHLGQLISIIRQLMLIPHDHSGEEVWTTVHEIVELAVSGRDASALVPENDEGTVSRYMSFEELKKRLARVGAADINARFQEKLDEVNEDVEMYRHLVSQMKMKEAHLTEVSDNVHKQNKQLKSMIKQFKASPQGFDWEMDPAFEWVSGSERDSSPPPPPPRISEDAAPPAPPADTESVSVVPLVPYTGGPPPVAPPPPAFGAPPAPGYVDGKIKKEAPPPNMKRKPVIDPGIKMKNFHWIRIKNIEIPSTLWFKLDDEGIKLDIEALKDNFSVVDREAKGKLLNIVPKKKKVELIKLIDEKRSYNIDLSLARFKVSPYAICDAIMGMDEEMLDVERLGQIIKCAPDRSEVETVKGFDGEPKLLGHTERFFLALSSVPNLQPRLDMWMFKMTFEDTFSDLRAKLSTVTRAVNGIESSTNFQKLLEIVLATGNFMNGGTRKGETYGFKLDTLRQLSNTKAKDKKTSLLMFIVKFCRKEYPEVRNFVDDFAIIAEAVRIEAQPFLAEVNKVAGRMESLKKMLKENKANPATDRFGPVMSAFYDSAVSRVDTLIQQTKHAEQRATKVTAMFGENTDKVVWEEQFAIFNSFTLTWVAAEAKLDAIQRKLEQEEKKKRAALARRHQKPTLKKTDSMGGVADQLFEELVAADPAQVMAQIKARRTQRARKLVDMEDDIVEESDEE